MESQKPPRPPAHDAKAANTAWRTIRKADGTEYQVFASESYVDFTAWTRKLRDTVNANAVFLDAVKGDLDSLRGTTDARLDNHATRLAALEAQPARPFP